MRATDAERHHRPPTTTDIPRPMSEDDVLAEHRDSEERVLSEGNERSAPTAADPSKPLHQVLGELRDALKCPDCGKTRAVMNVNVFARGRRPAVPERVSPDTHCACVGGPAYAGIGSTLPEGR